MNLILIIEDTITYRTYIELILIKGGYEVQTAANGTQGIAKVRERRPDLILCDILMPEMDGHTFLVNLHNENQYADIPIVFVTALDNRTELRRSMCEGADDYLTKPFSADELLSCVQGRLHRTRLLKSNYSLSNKEVDLEPLRKLTKRELEILLMVGAGTTSKIISEILGIRLNTVEVHRANIMKKLNAPNSALLGRWALMAEQMQKNIF